MMVLCKQVVLGETQERIYHYGYVVVTTIIIIILIIVIVIIAYSL